MARRLWPVALLLTAGCLADNKVASPVVSSDPFLNGPLQVFKGVTHSAYTAPATEAAEKRVLVVGQKVIAANKQLGLCPCFLTIGAPKDEIFHKGTSEVYVYVTEGLVQHCTTDAQLAAVICLELGKIVAERDALTPPDARQSEQLPPIEVPVGNDGGLNGPADGVRRMELAKFERKHPRNATPPDPVDPEALARKFLERAGFQSTDLDAAAPILRAAEVNYTFEKQFVKTNANTPNQGATQSEGPARVTLAPPIPVGQPGQAVAPIPPVPEAKMGTNP